MIPPISLQTLIGNPKHSSRQFKLGKSAQNQVFPWEAEIRDMKRKINSSQNNMGTWEEEDMEQDAISRKVLKDIGIKVGND